MLKILIFFLILSLISYIFDSKPWKPLSSFNTDFTASLWLLRGLRIRISVSYFSPLPLHLLMVYWIDDSFSFILFSCFTK